MVSTEPTSTPPITGQTMGSNSDFLEQRYGRGRRARGDRRLAIWLGSILAAGLLTFIVWSAFFQHAQVTGTVTQSIVNDRHSITVSFEVKNPTGKSVTCQISAINGAESSVGSRQVRLPAGQLGAQNIRIITVQPASSAVVDSCWTR